MLSVSTPGLKGCNIVSPCWAVGEMLFFQALFNGLLNLWTGGFFFWSSAVLGSSRPPVLHVLPHPDSHSQPCLLPGLCGW